MKVSVIRLTVQHCVIAAQVIQLREPAIVVVGVAGARAVTNRYHKTIEQAE